MLVREYQGERHTVTVVADGFVWQGATYGSLSTIARAITGCWVLAMLALCVPAVATAAHPPVAAREDAATPTPS